MYVSYASAFLAHLGRQSLPPELSIGKLTKINRVIIKTLLCCRKTETRLLQIDDMYKPRISRVLYQCISGLLSVQGHFCDISVTEKQIMTPCLYRRTVLPANPYKKLRKFF